MERSRTLPLIAVLLGLSVALVGCNKTTGGGSLTGLDGGGKITTGYQMRCDNLGNSGYLSGQIQYKDRAPTGVAFHGVIDQSLAAILGEDVTAIVGELVSCEDFGAFMVGQKLVGMFGTPAGSTSMGTYTPQPKNLGDGGELFVLVDTNGLGCSSDQDRLTVDLVGGVFDGYSETACLDHGNLTVFTE